MDRRKVLAVALLVILLAMVLGAFVSLQGSDSGVYGKILLGPTCPVQRVNDTSCNDKPYQATVVVKTADGLIELTQFSSNSTGDFRITLAPGTYILDPVSGNPLPRGSPQTVVVEQNNYTKVSISYDTGIR